MTRDTKIFLNGNRYWVRLPVSGPAPRRRPRVSTGTSDLRMARRVASMIDEMSETPAGMAWLARVSAGDTTLAVLYDHRSRGNLDALATLLTPEADLEPLVGRWIDEHLATRSVGAQLKLDYARQIRAFIPEGKPFPASDFNEDVLKEILHSLVDARSGEPLSGSTKRRYVAPLRLFYRYARKRVAMSTPFDEPDWLPDNNPARTTYWDHETVLRVLGHMTGRARDAMTLIFGTGMELGALLALTPAHTAGRGRIIVVPGTKNEARRDRMVFIDRWAYDALYGARLVFDFAPDGGDLRDAFYEAQVAAGVIAAPERSASGKKLWSRVKPHTIHDARHSYCYNRILGLDGESRQTLKFCAHQLGHTTEQMVMTIYSKCNMDERIRQLEVSEAFTAGTREMQHG